MASITLKQLKYCDAVARLGHFGRAAEVCAISQPAISVQIRELEETIGKQVFERGARQVRLTAFGADFVARAREVLRAVDDLEDMGRVGEDLAGRLRLGIIPTVAPYLLPRVIGALARSYPELELNVRETQTENLLAGLRDGALDTAILALPVSEPGLVEVPLFSESFVLVRPSADGDKPVPDAASLARMRLLLLEEGHCFRDQALSFCQMGAAVPRESMDGSSLSTLVQMVSAGIGVTLIPEMAVPVETLSADVAVARFPAPEPERQIGMVWRQTSPLAEQFGVVAEVVRGL
ncbi:MAG: LysR substrate-binding domain-containing protein [Pseudomonadota bacterium]